MNSISRRTLLQALASFAVTPLLGDDNWHINKNITRSFKRVYSNIYAMHGVDECPSSANHGFVGNCAFILCKHGVILIDSGGSYTAGQAILQQIKRITDKPVTAIFNTHNHADHWFGNFAIKEQFPKAKIYAHSKMKSSAQELYMGKYSYLGFSLKRAKRAQYADIAVEDLQKISIDGETFTIFHPTNAHTNCDIAIAHEQNNAIFMGDTLLSDATANFGLHSSIKGNIDFLERIQKHKTYNFYFPGHGQGGEHTSTFLPYYEYLKTIQQHVTKAMQKNIDILEHQTIIKEAIISELQWKNIEGFSFSMIGRFIDHLAQEYATEFF